VDTLTIYFYITLKFYSDQKQSVSLSLRQGHFRRGDISFYIQNPCQFETQLIKTTKYIPMVIVEKVGADISISTRCLSELEGLVMTQASSMPSAPSQNHTHPISNHILTPNRVQNLQHTVIYMSL
jgi:hypothetical protein